MLVEVRPLEAKTWHGKKGKESFAVPKAVEALYDETTGKYATGLDEEEADRYGKKLGVDLSNMFNPDEPHPYWSTKGAWVYLKNHTQVFDTTKDADFIKVKLLKSKSGKLVANSMKEYEDGLWPYATHVIFDEQEEVDAKASKIETRRKVEEIIVKMDPQSKANVIKIISGKSVDTRSINMIVVAMDELAQSKPEELLKVLNAGKDKVNMKARILEAIDAHILTKEGNGIYYMGDQIGIDIDNAVSYFLNPDHQQLKIVILEQLTKKK